MVNIKILNNQQWADNSIRNRRRPRPPGLQASLPHTLCIGPIIVSHGFYTLRHNKRVCFIFSDDFGKYRLVSIILALLQSVTNCSVSLHKSSYISLHLLHALPCEKFKCSNIQLYSSSIQKRCKIRSGKYLRDMVSFRSRVYAD